MRIGLHALGIGRRQRRPGRDRGAVARAADGAGFATLWSGEHTVMVDRPDAPYPYADDGKIAVPSDADWLDPLVTLAFAAAATSHLRLATGILLLPQHHPVLVAKQAASLDVLSGGRFVLGIGIGWSSEEFAALGIPFAGRGRRTREYVEVLRTLWRDDVASHTGEFIDFHEVRSYPKPVRDRRVPVVLGGNSLTPPSTRAWSPTATAGTASTWLPGRRARAAERAGRPLPASRPGPALVEVSALSLRSCRRAGRDRRSLEVSLSLRDGAPADAGALADLGVDELVVVEAPPGDAAAAERWVGGLARRWSVEPAPAG